MRNKDKIVKNHRLGHKAEGTREITNYNVVLLMELSQELESRTFFLTSATCINCKVLNYFVVTNFHMFMLNGYLLVQIREVLTVVPKSKLSFKFTAPIITLIL